MPILDTSIVLPASASPNLELQHSRICKIRTVYQRSIPRINVNKCTEDFPTPCVCVPHSTTKSTPYTSSQPSREAGRSPVLLQVQPMIWPDIAKIGPLFLQCQTATKEGLFKKNQNKTKSANSIGFNPISISSFHSISSA